MNSDDNNDNNNNEEMIENEMVENEMVENEMVENEMVENEMVENEMVENERSSLENTIIQLYTDLEYNLNHNTMNTNHRDFIYTYNIYINMYNNERIAYNIILGLFNEYNNILTNLITNLSQITNENTSPSSILEQNNIKFTLIEKNIPEYADYCCSICLFDYNDNDNDLKQEEQQEVIKINCNHIFHLICLSKWINENKQTCPLCRSIMN
jgi:hypothetical protein